MPVSGRIPYLAFLRLVLLIFQVEVFALLTGLNSTYNKTVFILCQEQGRFIKYSFEKPCPRPRGVNSAETVKK